MRGAVAAATDVNGRGEEREGGGRDRSGAMEGVLGGGWQL